jgi:hypothetical protein
MNHKHNSLTRRFVLGLIVMAGTLCAGVPPARPARAQVYPFAPPVPARAPAPAPARAPALPPAPPFSPAPAPPPARPAAGQDDWDAEKPNTKQAAGRAMMAPAIMQPADFDRWILGGRTRSQIEGNFAFLLTVQVDSVAFACNLSDAQRRKLELAGRGDIGRFFLAIEQLQAKARDVGQDQQKFNNIMRDMSPLQMKMQTGIFGESSLYRKVLAQTLDRGQADRYEQQEQERRKFRYEAKIELVVSSLENTAPLSAEQHQRLVKLLCAETQPPKKSSQYDMYFVLYQARKLDEAKFKPIVDDAQWQALKKMLDQARNMEPFLRSNELLPRRAGITREGKNER